MLKDSETGVALDTARDQVIDRVKLDRVQLDKVQLVVVEEVRVEGISVVRRKGKVALGRFVQRGEKRGTLLPAAAGKQDCIAHRALQLLVDLPLDSVGTCDMGKGQAGRTVVHILDNNLGIESASLKAGTEQIVVSES